MLSIQKKLSPAFYAILGLPSTAMGFALSVQIAVLSWILTTKFGLDIHEVGWVWAAGPLAGIIGQPIVGLISDNVWFWGGRRRPFIIVGGILAAISILALPNLRLISDTFHVSSLLAVAVTVALLLDLSINISFNPTRSIIADVTPFGEARTKGYTWMQSVSNIFGAMAYLVGALISNDVLIYFGVVVVLLFSIVPLFFIAEPRELNPVNEDKTVVEEGITTRWNELFKIYFAHGFSWIGAQTMFVFIIAFLQQKMFSPDVAEQYNAVQAALKDGQTLDASLQQVSDLVSSETGLMIGVSFFLLNAVGSIWPIALLQPLAKRFGTVRTHYMALFVMAIGYAGVALLAKDKWTLFALMSVVSIGWAAVVSLPFAVMSENVDKRQMGFFMGIFNLSVVLPQLLVSAVVGTIIMNTADKSIVFWISGGSLLISALIWMFVKEPSTNTQVTAPKAH